MAEQSNLQQEKNGAVFEEVNNGMAEKENAVASEANENPEGGEAVEKTPDTKPEADGDVSGLVEKAISKLQTELSKASQKDFAEPVINYLIGRVRDSASLAKDVLESHKNWSKCYDYIYKQARKTIKGNSGAVRDSVVFEWAEDYFHLDDKALAEQQAKEAAERAKKQKENAQKQKEDQKKRIEGMKKREAKREAEKSEKTAKEDASKKATAEIPKAKPKKGEMDGQLDLFSMMGL